MDRNRHLRTSLRAAGAFAFVAVVAACSAAGSSPSPSPSDAMMEASPSDAMMEASPSDAMMEASPSDSAGSHGHVPSGQRYRQWHGGPVPRARRLVPHDVFEDFSVGSNAGTHVILVPAKNVTKDGDVDAMTIVDLGALQGTAGMQDFPVPASADAMTYHSVVLWDSTMGHVIAAAPLQ